jgi:hypothetical protein
VLVLLMGEICEVAVEMASDDVIYVPSIMTIGSGIRVILRMLSQQFERILCWHYQ